MRSFNSSSRNYTLVQPRKSGYQFHTSIWLIILLIFFFPPIALYFMKKEREYHNWFPIIVWICSGFILVLIVFYSFFTLPRLMLLLEDFDAPNNSPPSIEIMVVLVIFTLAQVIFGFLLKRKLRANNELSRCFMWTAITIIVLDYLFCLLASRILVISSLFPLYDLTSHL